MDTPENNLIKIQVEREIKSLFKYYLETLEELKLDKDQHDILRKRILDHSNDTIRELLNFLYFFDFNINVNKLNEATKDKPIYRKTIVSSPVIVEYNNQ
jgi:nicotinic acid phosphoribosyltransferase